MTTMSQTCRCVAAITLMTLLAWEAVALPLPLVNAGAEGPADDDPGRPAGVDTWQQDHINVTFSRDTTVKRSGEASFYVHNKGSQPPGKDGTAVFMFTGPIDAGLDYTATAWLKTRDVSNASIRVRRAVSLVIASSEWCRLE